MKATVYYAEFDTLNSEKVLHFNDVLTLNVARSNDDKLKILCVITYSHKIFQFFSE